MGNYVQRFMLEDLDIRGAIVQLDSVWQQMLQNRQYPYPVLNVLGEISATALLIGDNFKQTGRLTIQLNGNGPVSMLVVDCNEALHLRGMAKCNRLIEQQQPIVDLLGNGQLVLTLDMPSMKKSYQSIVPLEGESITEMFEHYFMQSEQLSSRLFLKVADDTVFGILLQKLPTTDQQDADGWVRAEALAATIHDDNELPKYPAEEILKQLFFGENIRVFDQQTVHYGCQENPAKVYAMLRSLGRQEVESILQEFGEVVINDDICNQVYRFDALMIDAVFREADSTIH